MRSAAVFGLTDAHPPFQVTFFPPLLETRLVLKLLDVDHGCIKGFPFRNIHTIFLLPHCADTVVKEGFTVPCFSAPVPQARITIG